MQKQTRQFLVYFLANGGPPIAAGLGVVMDFPIWFFTVLAAFWLLTAGWTLCEFKAEIRNAGRRIRGKETLVVNFPAFRVLDYWDETSDLFQPLKESLFKKRFRKTIITANGDVERISHPDPEHWSNKRNEKS